MKILLLSFYYSPDLSAGSFRTTSLVNALKKKLPKNSHIQVLTTAPNRYGSFFVEAPQMEHNPGLHVHRFVLPGHQSGMLDQSKAFLSYWWQVMQHIEHGNYDLVLGTSSRLMTAVLAARVAQKKKAFLYLDIRDIFVDTIKDVLPKSSAAVLKPVFNCLECWAIQRANKVNLVSKGFAEYFKKKYPNQRYSFFSNGIDTDFLEASINSNRPKKKENGLLTILYAGNLGAGQGLDSILPGLAQKLQGLAVFKIIGDGGRKNALFSALARNNINNVALVNPMKRDMLIEEYEQADILFMHLSDYEAFKKVLPSKIFEYAATGKPIWAGVAGFAAKFIRDEVSNAAVFKPNDISGAMSAFEQLALYTTPRLEFVRKFSRTTIMDEMAEDVIGVANLPG